MVHSKIWVRHAKAWLGLGLAWQAGELATRYFDLPLPPALTGMALLFGVLATRPAWAQTLEPASRNLLAVLPLFFIPAGAKIVALAPRLAAAWMPITAVVFLSTGLALAATAWTFRMAAAWAARRERT